MACMKLGANFGDRPRFARLFAVPLCAPMRARKGSKEEKERKEKASGRLFTARSLFRPRARERGLSTFERPVCTAARITREGKRLEGGKRFNLHSWAVFWKFLGDHVQSIPSTSSQVIFQGTNSLMTIDASTSNNMPPPLSLTYSSSGRFGSGGWRGEPNLTDGEKRWKLLLFARLSSKLSPMFINRTNNRCWEEPWERELIDLKSRWIEEDLGIFETKIQQRDYEWIFVHFCTFPKVGFPFPGTFRNVCRVFGDRSMRRGEVARSEREIKRCWNFWARNGDFSENCKRIITR